MITENQVTHLGDIHRIFAGTDLGILVWRK